MRQMDRLNSYVLTGTVGVGATTIAAAIVGNPVPVVIPAGLAAVGIGAHHMRETQTNDVEEAADADVREAVGAVADGGDR